MTIVLCILQIGRRRFIYLVVSYHRFMLLEEKCFSSNMVKCWSKERKRWSISGWDRRKLWTRTVRLACERAISGQWAQGDVEGCDHKPCNRYPEGTADRTASDIFLYSHETIKMRETSGTRKISKPVDVIRKSPNVGEQIWVLYTTAESCFFQ